MEINRIMLTRLKTRWPESYKFSSVLIMFIHRVWWYYLVGLIVWPEEEWSAGHPLCYADTSDIQASEAITISFCYSVIASGFSCCRTATRDVHCPHCHSCRFYSPHPSSLCVAALSSQQQAAAARLSQDPYHLPLPTVCNRRMSAS